MSFLKTNDVVKDNDIAIIYLNHNTLYPVKITRSWQFNMKYGSLKYADVIGKKYGSKIHCSKGTVYILQGSPEIWTVSLPHRTQILYTPDISFITLQLELKPGSIVLESGTGSASLSHAIVRSTFPSGHLHTFEFHKQRSETARKEFEEHQMSNHVTVYHRDICAEGFGLKDIADAVFLDIPNPWLAIQSAKDALKQNGGRICSFSPCMEQVQKTSEELKKQNFIDIQTFENLRCIYSVKNQTFPEFDFNMNNANKNGDEDKDNKKGESNNKRHKNKKQKTDSDDSDSNGEEGASVYRQYCAKPINLQPGHTGYLTFASLLNKNYAHKSQQATSSDTKESSEK